MIALRNVETGLVWQIVPDGVPFNLTERGFFCKQKQLNAPCPQPDWEVVEASDPAFFVPRAMSYNDGVWSILDQAAYDLALAEKTQKARLDAQAAMVSWINAFLQPFTEKYPDTEVMTWPMQSSAARAHLNGDARIAETEFLSGLASRQGVTADEMAAIIVAKADRYERAVQETAGLRSATMDALESASLGEIPAILDAAKASAISKAKGLGLI